ncbi:hypothetical protein FRB95_010546 [Tulasnella sp. JGI-2019a]|nr:hypothetical protein FRB95_010546 [Tulasnella sp. JGI-2019a]
MGEDVITISTVITEKLPSPTREFDRIIDNVVQPDYLPFELLVKIFRLCCGIDCQESQRWSEADYTKVLHKLAQVCRVWAETITKSSELWTVVQGTQSTQTSLAVLKLSQDRPLGVEVGFKNQAILHEVLKRFHRWEWARLYIDIYHGESFRPLLEREAPVILRSFELGYKWDPNRTPQILNLFHDHAPGLKHLRLASVLLRNWSSPILHGLRTLEMSYFRSGPSFPSLQNFVDALRACHVLEDLVLKEFNILGHDVQPGSVAHLPRLQRLHIDAMPNMSISILSVMDTPTCTDYFFSIPDLGYGDRVLLAIVSYVSDAFQNHLLTGDFLRLTSGYTDVVVQITPDDPALPEFRLRFHAICKSNAILQWVLPLIDKDRPNRGPIPAEVRLRGYDGTNGPKILRRRLSGVMMVTSDRCGLEKETRLHESGFTTAMFSNDGSEG